MTKYRGIRGLKEAFEATESGVIFATGMTGGQTAFACAQLYREQGGQMLLLVPSTEKARRMREYLDYFTGGADIYILPEETQNLARFDAKSRVLGNQRIECLNAARSNERAIFIAPVMGAAYGLSEPRFFAEREIRLGIGLEAEGDLRSRLTEIGYERVTMTEAGGQFSVRGGIVDVFPPGAEYPYRIDLFDTEVDDIKEFDPLTQRSVRSLDSVTIIPAGLPAPDRQEASFFWDYMKNLTVLCADEWDRICGALDLADREWASLAAGIEDSEELPKREVFADADRLAELMMSRRSVIAAPFSGNLRHIDRQAALVDAASVASATFSGQMGMFGNELKRLLEENYTVHIVSSTEERRENLRNFVFRSEIPGSVNYLLGSIPSGMYFTADRTAIISDGDIFRTGKKKRTRRAGSKRRKMATFADFREGDFVVHENHGIGRYVGIKPMEIEGVRRDYIVIRYAGSDMLYVPVEQMDLVQPYIGSGGQAPKINRLSTPEWRKTKVKARAAIEHMAEELVRLSAERKMEQGHAFNTDSTWQRQFDDMFPYEETEDQLRAVEEIRADMAGSWPMDRLLCGDVGFGKTEVAARAVFTCVMDGKQAAILVPTTLLADQHYRTFRERFEKFPVTIEMMSRFRTESEQKKTLQGLADGRVDVVIGTHRLLSSDVKFKDLGLLVVDEEQRFGVQHKEAIKMLRKNVDVLALSATPIPRTLHMSMSGIRGMSTLEEPPEERLPVQTFVMEQDDGIIREILLREIGRGGQAFVIYNRVKGINIIADRIRNLVPEARVCAAHGRMPENKLEDVMADFIAGEYDVMVATTIVESGIDIKSANTLIVMDADRYGLAQLYQLRGRVGRSDVPAYAYFMYQKDKILTEVAEQRLRTIMEFTEFGSGFRVAMKDLEIRGAGNLLGVEQSGHMMTIGYELYCKLIDEAMRKLKGETVREEEQEVTIDVKVDAYVPSGYVTDENTRLDVYKRIAGIQTAEDVSDVTDELIDRFGEVPEQVQSLIRVAYIKALAGKAGMDRITKEPDGIRFGFPPGAELNEDGFLRVFGKYKNRAAINMSSRPFIRLSAAKGRRMLEESAALLETFNGIK